MLLSFILDIAYEVKDEVENFMKHNSTSVSCVVISIFYMVYREMHVLNFPKVLNYPFY